MLKKGAADRRLLSAYPLLLLFLFEIEPATRRSEPCIIKVVSTVALHPLGGPLINRLTPPRRSSLGLHISGPPTLR